MSPTATETAATLRLKPDAEARIDDLQARYPKKEATPKKDTAPKKATGKGEEE